MDNAEKFVAFAKAMVANKRAMKFAKRIDCMTVEFSLFGKNGDCSSWQVVHNDDLFYPWILCELPMSETSFTKEFSSLEDLFEHLNENRKNKKIKD